MAAADGQPSLETLVFVLCSAQGTNRKRFRTSSRVCTSSAKTYTVLTPTDANCNAPLVLDAQRTAVNRVSIVSINNASHTPLE